MTDRLDRIMAATGQPSRAAAGALLEKWQRQDERKDAERTRRLLSNHDYAAIVRQSPDKAAKVFRNYRDQADSVMQDKMIPYEGRLWKQGELKNEALAELQKLAAQTDTVAVMAKRQLLAERDRARPVVDSATHEKLARQFSYLVDKGVPIGNVIEEHKRDPTAVCVLQDEAPVLARGQSPQDRQAGDGPSAMLRAAAFEVFGDEYREKARAVDEFDKSAYMAEMAVKYAQDAVKHDSDELVIANSAGEAFAA